MEISIGIPILFPPSPPTKTPRKTRLCLRTSASKSRPSMWYGRVSCRSWGRRRRGRSWKRVFVRRVRCSTFWANMGNQNVKKRQSIAAIFCSKVSSKSMKTNQKYSTPKSKRRHRPRNPSSLSKPRHSGRSTISWAFLLEKMINLTRSLWGLMMMSIRMVSDETFRMER